MKLALSLLIFLTLTQNIYTKSACEKCYNRVSLYRQLANGGSALGTALACRAICSRLFSREVKFFTCIGACSLGGIGLIQQKLKPYDTIFLCQKQFQKCDATNCQGDCVDIKNFETSPKVAKPGQEIDLLVDLEVMKTAGSGELLFYTNGKNIRNDNIFIDKFEIGKFQKVGKIQLDDTIEPGTYRVQARVCQGKCGSNHESSRQFDTELTTFQVVKK